ncbi:MAG TPA: hypothetical protein VFM09_05005 [Marmoricola sp.]|nr:hypothetical protein [Marmoricola sp.]
MTTQTHGRPAAPTVARTRPAVRWVVPASCLLIAAQLAYRAWASFGSYWERDDLLLVSRVFGPHGRSPDVLLQGFAGHVMPAGFLVTWLLNRVAPYDWTVAAACMTLMQGLASLAFLRLLVVAFGRRWGIVPPLLVYLATAYTVQSSVWWVVAVQLIPLQISFFCAMASQVEYLRTRRRSSALAAMAWVLLGLAFYEKSILTIGALAIVSLAWFTRGTFRERLGQLWADYRFSVLGNTVLGSAYLALYVRYGLDFSPGQAVDVPIGPTADTLVLRSWATAAVGGPLTWLHTPGAPISFAQPAGPVVVAAWVVLGLLVWQLGRSRTASLRALWLPAFYLACDLVLVVAGRSGVGGPAMGLEYRYLTELSAVNATALAFALMPVKGAVEPVQRKQPSPWLDRVGPAALSCVVVALLGTWSTSLYILTWHRNPDSGDYLAHLVHDARTMPTGTPVIDVTAPGNVQWTWFYPDNTVSHMMRALQPPLRYVTVATDRVRIPDAHGHLRPADVTPARHGVVGGRPACGAEVGQGIRTIPLDRGVAPGRWWLKVGYIATGDSAITVEAGGRTRRTSVRPGLHTLYVATGAEAFSSIRLGGLVGDVRLCTHAVTVGQPVPREAP